ncbi:glycosyltransferase family 9 protein [Flavobacterium sp. RHBU_3]|uniref:glycosyltransferase family 9 protein n=1 Tax=Flavobacterium sp. RHBU_3 TaxID=3391184 RepID=UPI00398525C0
MSPTKNKHYKHLLILRFSAMGDVAMTVPVLHALVQQHPNVHVTVVSRKNFKPFFDGIPHVSFYSADFNKHHKGFMGLIKLYKELKALHIYAVADLHNVLRSKVIAKFFAWRGKKTATIDKLRNEQKALTAANNKNFEPLPRIVYRHADVLAQLGFPVKLDETALLPKPALNDEIKQYSGSKAGTWIGIAPFAQHKGKVYPADLMQEVIDALAKRPGTKLFLFGGSRDEAHKLKKMANDRENIVVIAGGKLTLKQELQIISNLNLMISMDSANGHMAAMYGVPVVTLWGATHPYSGFVPYNQPLFNSITANREQYPLLPTSVYGNKEVPGYEDAMRTITPQMVVDKVEELLMR